MAKSSPRVRATLAAATLAAAAVTGITLAATAGATTEIETDDPRAEAHDGRTQDSCSFVGLDGERVDLANIEFEGGDDQQSVTIISIADGLDVTGIVVKGGPGYNIYVPGERGLEDAPAWEDLVSPIHPESGQVPAISHWFICAEGEPDVPTSTPPSQTTTTTPGETTTTVPDESTTPGETTTTVPDESTTPGEPITTTEDAPETTPESSTPAPAPVPDGDDDDLALTGFDAGWLIPVGLLLLLGGGAVLWLARTRRNMV